MRDWLWIGRSAAWVGLFAAILALWAWTVGMAAMSGVDWMGRPVGMNMMPMESLGALVPMWLLMMAAMMLPVMAPALGAYERLIPRSDATRAGWLGVLAGYLAVWLLVAAALAAVQFALMRGGHLDGLGAATTRWFSVALLIVVGLFQLTRIKEVCHGKCHTPTLWFLGHWQPGFAGGLRMGTGLGAWCAACCWGYMALAFTGGAMSLLWMAGATALMVLEKLPQIGHLLLKPVGLAMIGVGVLLPFL